MNNFGSIVWEMDITVGDRPKQIYFDSSLVIAGCEIDPFTKSLVDGTISRYPREQTLRVVCVTVASLGCEVDTHLTQILNRARTMGLIPGKQEMALQLGIQRTHHPAGELVYVATQPFTTRVDTHERFLSLHKIGTGKRKLRAVEANWDSCWKPSTQFVLQKVH